MIRAYGMVAMFLLMLPNLLREPADDGDGQKCFSNAMVPWLLRKMAYHTEPGFMNFHDCAELLYENTVLLAAHDVAYVCGDMQSNDLAFGLIFWRSVSCARGFYC